MSRFRAIDSGSAEATWPLNIGLVGPSYSGKTMGALRVATGIQRVNEGPIVYGDTEGGRALEYKNRFSFKHINFQPPYGSLDYCEFLEEAIAFFDGTMRRARRVKFQRRYADVKPVKDLVVLHGL